MGSQRVRHDLGTKKPQQFIYFFLIFVHISEDIWIILLLLLLFSHWVMSNSLRPHEWQHIRLPCSSLSPRVYSSPLSQWCQPVISSSVAPFSSCPKSFPASGSFPMNQLLVSGGQSFGASASASKEYSGLISLRIDWLDLHAVQGTFKSLFSKTTVQKHQFFSLLYGLTCTFIHDYWKNHSFDLTDLCWQSDVCAF